jgi:REP element-mobilizing transposase RayT
VWQFCANPLRRVARAANGRYVRSMPRPLRPQAAGGFYHVTCRGNRGQPIFRDPDDHRFHLWCLDRVAARYNWRVLTWVHMTNHFHMSVITETPTLSRGMQWLNGVYGQVFNNREGLTGHLFQGRFHSVAIESEEHFLECTRYDVLNPWRAGLCDHPLSWRWHGMRATLGLEPAPLFLDVDRLLSCFARETEEGRRRYLEFVECSMREQIRTELRLAA